MVSSGVRRIDSAVRPTDPPKGRGPRVACPPERRRARHTVTGARRRRQEYIDKQSGDPWDYWKPDVGFKRLGLS